tara:strand:+ start:132 stop:1340 length:1209 start_codon:yes stop_codon:yes gene_type:complete
MQDEDIAMDHRVVTPDTPAKTKKIEMSGKTWYIPYHEYSGGRVIDWESSLWNSNPSEGVIVISAKDPTRFEGCTLKPFPDQETGVRIGWQTGQFDPTSKQPLLGFFRISSRTVVLNLKNLRDRKLYIFLARNPMVSGSANVSLGSEVNTMFLIDDKEQSAKSQTSNRKLKIKALLYLDEAEDIEIEGLARATGNMQEGEPVSIVRNNLEAYAELSPKVFMDFVESKDKAFKVTIAEAKGLGVLVHSVNKGWMHKMVPLGLTDDSVLEAIKGNIPLFREISKEVDKKRNPDHASEIEVDAPIANDPEKDALKKQNDALMARLEALENGAPAQDPEPALGTAGHVINEPKKNYDIDSMGRNALWTLAAELEYPNDEWAKLKKTDDMQAYMKQKLGQVPKEGMGI